MQTNTDLINPLDTINLNNFRGTQPPVAPMTSDRSLQTPDGWAIECRGLVGRLKDLRTMLQIDNRQGEGPLGDITDMLDETAPQLLDRIAETVLVDDGSLETALADEGFLLTIVGDEWRIYLTQGQYLVTDVGYDDTPTDNSTAAVDILGTSLNDVGRMVHTYHDID